MHLLFKPTLCINLDDESFFQVVFSDYLKIIGHFTRKNRGFHQINNQSCSEGRVRPGFYILHQKSNTLQVPHPQSPQLLKRAAYSPTSCWNWVTVKQSRQNSQAQEVQATLSSKRNYLAHFSHSFPPAMGTVLELTLSLNCVTPHNQVMNRNSAS